MTTLLKKLLGDEERLRKFMATNAYPMCLMMFFFVVTWILLLATNYGWI